MNRWGPTCADEEPFRIDTSVAHMARVNDYLLGGTDNFAVDRELAEHTTAALPGGIDGARVNVRANRAFLAWAVRFLAGGMGIHQFLDIGTGIPNADTVHGVAQQVAPTSRVVYVDHDAVVLAHAHALLKTTPRGATAYVHADLRDPETILATAAETLDFSRPVALMLVGVLHHILDHENPYGIVGRLLAGVPSGSYLVVSHLASDIHPEAMAELAARHNQAVTAEAAVVRDHAGVCRFFDGLELVAPGVTPLDHWPDQQTRTIPAGYLPIPIYGAIGRKP
jgi:hypothetical protein